MDFVYFNGRITKHEMIEERGEHLLFNVRCYNNSVIEK